MDPFIGEIRLLPYNFAPRFFVACDGAQLPLNEETSTLFALIGNAFGGDGKTNYKLPDLRDKSPFPPNTQGGYFIATNGVFPPRGDEPPDSAE
jgi:microcystin-dependent protein